MSTEEAFSAIRELAEDKSPARPELEVIDTHLYTQPVNKSVPCKLPTSQGQLDRNNFRVYCDGDCKGGFAYGLGRDIAISDTHHVEEITIYGDNGKASSSPGTSRNPTTVPSGIFLSPGFIFFAFKSVKLLIPAPYFQLDCMRRHKTAK